MNKETIEIDINKNVYGYYVLSSFIGNLYFIKKYMDYTKKDCLKLFKESINNEIFINNFNIYDCKIIVNDNTKRGVKC
tara:strand:+ start:307 stop:540 length:234 start_codon:yes stop_codon:yes gene_type:complete